ncbi:hypothetical protein ElyMa_001287100, partial [Elysia marginata]
RSSGSTSQSGAGSSSSQDMPSLPSSSSTVDPASLSLSRDVSVSSQLTTEVELQTQPGGSVTMQSPAPAHSASSLPVGSSTETGSSTMDSAPIDLVGANENVSNTVDIETSDQAALNTPASGRSAPQTSAATATSTSLRLVYVQKGSFIYKFHLYSYRSLLNALCLDFV